MMLKIFDQLEVFHHFHRQPRMKPPRFADFTETIARLAPRQEVHDIRATWGIRTVIKSQEEKPQAIAHARKMLARDLLADAREEVIDCLDLLYAEGFRSDDPVFTKLDRLARLLAGDDVTGASEATTSATAGR